MLLPDCIEVCSFSTTSPSWMMSCLTLMPVISSKAFASVFDSYSCVVIVSETTEISLTPLACSFLAASMNHFISAACWSLLSVDGWNSLSIHFFASASPAHALWPMTRAAAAKATEFKRSLISVSSQVLPDSIPRHAAGKGWPPAFSRTCSRSALAHDQREHPHRNHEADPYRRLSLQAE